MDMLMSLRLRLLLLRSSSSNQKAHPSDGSVSSSGKPAATSAVTNMLRGRPKPKSSLEEATGEADFGRALGVPSMSNRGVTKTGRYRCKEAVTLPKQCRKRCWSWETHVAPNRKVANWRKAQTLDNRTKRGEQGG